MFIPLALQQTQSTGSGVFSALQESLVQLFNQLQLQLQGQVHETLLALPALHKL